MKPDALVDYEGHNKVLMEELGVVAAPLIEWMNKLHPHHTVIVTSTSAELTESKCRVTTFNYVKD